MARSRRGLAALALLALFLGSGLGLPETSPGGCADDCDDEGSGCVDCPLCSPTRTAVLVTPCTSPETEPFDSWTAPPVAQASRPEDRGVFHVPKTLA
jgi:hypothetical protein